MDRQGIAINTLLLHRGWSAPAGRASDGSDSGALVNDIVAFGSPALARIDGTAAVCMWPLTGVSDSPTLDRRDV